MTAPAGLASPDIDRWRTGNTGTEGVWRFESGAAGRDVLVTALIHGNEICGAWALADALQAGLRPRRGALTLALCNLAAFDRQRCVDEDLNRVWGSARIDGDSVERRRARELLPFAERADWLLDLHSMHDAGPPLMLTGMRPDNMVLARAIGSPALLVADAGHANGCRLRDHGHFAAGGGAGARSLLVECGSHDEPAARTVASDVLARFLVAAGSIDLGDVPAPWLQPLPPRQQAVRVTEAVVCAAGEPPRLAASWCTGQRVEHAGTVLGVNGGQPFATPYDGCTLIMPSADQVQPGQTIVRLARDLEG